MKSLLRCLAVATLSLAGPAWAASPLDGAGQVVVVTSEGWDSTHGRLQAFTRSGSGWKPEGAAFDVALGRSGSAWGIGLHPATSADAASVGNVASAGDDRWPSRSSAGTRDDQRSSPTASEAPASGQATSGPRKREGDGRSPAGVFALGTAFGYAAQADTALPWQPMQESSYCMDVPDSPYYNRIVDAERVGAEAVEGSTEPMRLDLHNEGDVRYQQGFVINHNPRNVPGQGSCIFAHLWRREGEATAGCTAMTAAHMQQLLAWLDARQGPLFVLLPRAEYVRLQHAWQLPALAAAHDPTP
jgi:L,D-peptidoglycan transpeptidase YkuD (ErfK/YbiS/YcfS/YnhG family)